MTAVWPMNLREQERKQPARQKGMLQRRWREAERVGMCAGYRQHEHLMNDWMSECGREGSK